MRKILYVLMLMSFLLFTGCQSLKNLANTGLNPKPDSTSENTSDSTSKDSSGNNGDTTEDKGSTETKDDSTKLTIKDYFPFKENVKFTYEGQGNEYASYTSWVDYIREDRIQLRTNNGGTEAIKVLENKDGELKLILTREESYYREDLTSKESNKNEILLKEPLIKGTSWTLSEGRKRYISNIDVSISTPAGDYKALEVTTEDNDTKMLDYYALNTGLVKTVFTSKDTKVTSSLKKIEENSQLTQNIKVYYPNGAEEKLYFSTKSLSFKTNDITKASIEKIFKESPEKNLGKLLGANTKINSLYLNKDNMVYVDFSKNFVSEMNSGAQYETLILQGITNTLASYYGVDKVYITIENNPYSSGHITLKKGQFLTVNTKNSIEYKK